jgi:uncharacterized protein YndB with AHSA1/START domain
MPADASRSFENSIAVPGTPEQVWEAIATGPGTEAWFVPAEIEGREGGPVALDVGGGMQPAGVVTGWEPPRRFAYEEEYEGARLATEFLVEARSGGTCVVRLVTTVFGAGPEWDAELDNLREGWDGYLLNLRRYLTEFAGRPCATILVSGTAPGPRDRAWAALMEALGLEDAAPGGRVAAGDGAPTLGGVVDRETGGERHRELMLRLDAPAPGTAFVMVYASGEHVHANVHAYLYGDAAREIAERDAPLWQAWMAERF